MAAKEGLMEDSRIIRVPVQVGLLRSMDALILNRVGGYESRAEFVREAIEALVMELTYEPAGDLGSPSSRSVSVVPVPEAPAHRQASMDMTALEVPSELAIVEGAATIDAGPMFGLHNRDYPSLWALVQIAQMTSSAAQPFEDCAARLMASAWSFGETLLALEQAGEGNLAALFPTNRAKPQSAQAAFENFAVGGYSLMADQLRAYGPLFAWRTCQLEVGHDARVLVGLTEQGHELITALDGLVARMPHPQPQATAFVRHLQRHCPEDWWGFELVLIHAENGVGRERLAEVFREEEPTWGSSVAATNAAGYVARAREWGLLEPQMVDREYRLSEYGQSVLASERNVA
jgi:hypothetical protein